ncbi:hypothetical protein [Denitrificimonas caeni]|uniref:Pyrroloquinoline quinone biosynthesis protein PqqE n=1 Tax=Denitrificimonas caeni TaxID=521720 RepID=A0AAE9VTK7_9GAMM|nr:hypothetical protein [Denitrificimonas caeni]NLJ11558.1 hypothetical protein [Gammaproteobacteria bacterium]WBE25634.1 hypothetical protein O6P33_01950 [Denitrificimonas caeni]
MQISANVFSAGLSAIKTGQEQLANAAQAIAQSSQNSASSSAAATAPSIDLANITEQLMQLEQAKQMSELGAKVLSTAEESLGTLIDIQA